MNASPLYCIRLCLSVPFLVALLVFVALLPLPASAFDTVHWRGAGQSGSFDAPELPATWSMDGENLLWKADVGSRSAPLVLNDKVYVINRAGEGATLQERVACLDLNTGKRLWEHRFNAFLTDIVASRLGWSNLAADPKTGNIYAHGVQGLFFCFSPDGEVLWKYSFTEEFGRISGYGGRTNTPIIHGNLVIMSSLISGWGPFGKPGHRYWAMDKKTGDMVWWSSPSEKPLDTTYATPVIKDGRLYSAMADGAAVCLDPNTGERHWRTAIAKRGINTSVIVEDGLVIVGNGEENLGSTTMGSLVALNAEDGSEAWRIDGLRAGYATPAYHDGLLYVPDNSANLFCVELKTGKQLWELNYGKEAKGSPTYADGKIYVGDVSGEYNILKVGRDGGEKIHHLSFKEEDGSPIAVFGTPVVAHGRVILPTMNSIYCISLKDAAYRDEGKAPSASDAGGASPVGGMVPCEVILNAGEPKTFRLAGVKGRKKADWSLKGIKGTIKNGKLVPEAAPAMQAGVVVAKIGDTEYTSRVRIRPSLPYKETFDDLPEGAPPPGWITSRLKSIVTTLDGEKVLKKLATSPHPAFARMRNYMMDPMDVGYTVQTDVYGMAKKKRFLPDMGVINSRYLLIMLGTSAGRERKLRISSWAAIPRLQLDIPFEWEAEKWYTVKLKTTKKGEEVLVQGKVWPRDEDEPDAWTIEVTDKTPNPAGSPALYGFSTAITSTPGTEIYYDNVEVSR